ncbi:MAG TPA: phosphoglycolate phosphatase [Beijerinckiaceae bacterium]|jgi:phosphoglycolate phosphatase
MLDRSYATIDAVLLDLDGTLVDSARDLQEALNRLLAEEGLRSLDLSEVKGMIGDGVRKLLERALAAAGSDPARVDALLPRYLALYEGAASHHTDVYPGVRDTLQELRGEGLHLAVVTNKPEAATRIVLEALGLDAFLDAVIGGDTLPQRKPDPAPLHEALRRLGVGPDRAVMVGDNHHDVNAARAAGVRAIVVGYGYAHGAPEGFGADGLIDAFAELPAALRALDQ